MEELFMILQAEAQKALSKYGVGSCGPRGFYGTMGNMAIVYSLQWNFNLCGFS